MQSGNTLIEGAAVTGQSAKKSFKKRSRAGKKKKKFGSVRKPRVKKGWE